MPFHSARTYICKSAGHLGYEREKMNRVNDKITRLMVTMDTEEINMYVERLFLLLPVLYTDM